MADVVVPVVLENLIKLLGNEANLLQGVKDQVSLLQGDLGIMNAFLKDSVGKRSEHHFVKEVVNQIKEAALEAENVIDTYLAQVIKQRRRKPVGKLLHSFGHAKILHGVANKTTSIKMKIKNIYDNKATYGIVEAESSVDAEAEQSLRRRRRKVEEDDVVGFLDDTKTLVSQLTDQDNLQLDVISIIGMGGLGKTTLARKIYNDTRVKNYFSCCAWVFVSQEYRVRSLLLDILKCFNMSKSKWDKIYKMSDDELEATLRDYLRGRRYFVVMDDIWKTQVWEEIKDAFPNDSNGSRILITSREKEVASHASPTHPFFLPFLDNQASWELLRKKVFRGGECPSNLEILGRQLAESCKGLPLSIIVLGGILANKDKSPRIWSNFIGHVNSYLTEDRTRCLDILALSYNHLPCQLKPCFLYFGMFPEDYEIQAREVIKLWIAERFVQKIGNRKVDDIAEDYLEELVDRSLIQVASRRRDGSVKTCRIHDLLRDLCIKESIQENFFEFHSEANNLSSPRKPRRLSVLCDPTQYVSRNACDTSSARSLIFFCQGGDFQEKHWNWILKGFKFIRVLTLLDVGHISLIPKKIEKLIFLRHFSIQKKPGEISLDIDTIPDSICNLPYLETIDVNLTVRNSFWPKSIWRLKHLRHLNIHPFPFRILPPEPQREKDDNTLCNLQVINSINMDSNTALVISLFPNLTVLKLNYRYQEQMKEFEVAEAVVSLENLQYLKRLSLVRIPKFEPGLELLPSTLSKVSFKYSYVDLHVMKILGKLPNLLELKIIQAMNFPPMISMVAGEFPQLQVLKMFHNYIEQWELEKDAMPNLQYLLIFGLRWSEALPDQLWHMEALRSAEIGMTSSPRKLRKKLRKMNCVTSERAVYGVIPLSQRPVWELTINNTSRVSLIWEQDDD